MSLIPHRFLLRIAYPCRYAAAMPDEAGDRLLDLPESCRIDNFAGMDGQRNFADLRLAWNETGIGLQVEVRGKEQVPQGDASRPRSSDGVTLWIDSRDARSSHRASRYCHQFHFLPTGAGPDLDEPAFVQAKINRCFRTHRSARRARCRFRPPPRAAVTSWKRSYRRPCSTGSTRSRTRGLGSILRCATRNWANRF